MLAVTAADDAGTKKECIHSLKYSLSFSIFKMGPGSREYVADAGSLSKMKAQADAPLFWTGAVTEGPFSIMFQRTKTDVACVCCFSAVGR